MWRADVRAGAALVMPMLVGVVPFGLVAGATPASHGLGTGAAIGFSTIVFAGASQLAAMDVLIRGGAAAVAIAAACTINLRMLLYSASLAPHLADQSLRRRLLVAYLLTDQAYAVSIARWAGVQPDEDPHDRFAYYVGAGGLLWISWQIATITGALAGAALPKDVPLDFAIPLVFLVLLVPAITTRPAAVAAIAGGAGAVIGAELGAGNLSILVGAALGIAAGALAEGRGEGAAP
jgi:predicted branched-subunit amino acid permease